MISNSIKFRLQPRRFETFIGVFWVGCWHYHVKEAKTHLYTNLYVAKTNATVFKSKDRRFQGESSRHLSCYYLYILEIRFLPVLARYYPKNNVLEFSTLCFADAGDVEESPKERPCGRFSPRRHKTSVFNSYFSQNSIDYCKNQFFFPKSTHLTHSTGRRSHCMYIGSYRPYIEGNWCCVVESKVRPQSFQSFTYFRPREPIYIKNIDWWLINWTGVGVKYVSVQEYGNPHLRTSKIKSPFCGLFRT